MEHRADVRSRFAGANHDKLDVKCLSPEAPGGLQSKGGLFFRPKIRFVEKGHKKGEDVYWVWGAAWCKGMIASILFAVHLSENAGNRNSLRNGK